MPQDKIESQLQKTFQLMAFVGPAHAGIDDALFVKAVLLLYEWAKKYANGIPFPEEPKTMSGSNSTTGKSVALIYEPEELFLTLRLSASRQDGAREHVEVEIRPCNTKLIIGIKATTFVPSSSVARATFKFPDFLLALICTVGLNDGVPITEKPWRISSHEIKSFINFLSSSERQLPLIAISQAKNPSIGVNGYAIDVWRCSKALVGVAHVAAIPWETTFDLSESIGSDWSCFNGAVRIYWPHIDFCMDSPYSHPLYTLRNINNTAYGGTFEDYLRQSACYYNRTRSIDWSAFGIKFYIEAERLRITDASGQETPEQIITRYREQITRMHESLEEYTALADEYYADMIACREDSETMRRQMIALTGMVNRQRTEIKRLTHGEGEKVPLDLDYRALPSWVEQYYPDRILLHPRAIRALKNAVYQNPSMVYRCLVLLAEDYHDYRMGILSRENFLKKCSAVDPGLTECDCGELSNINAEGDVYYVTYGGRRCLLNRHLKKGVSHNPLYCLRIYFFWDAKNSIVVIGSLPGHLRSAKT